MLSAGPEIVVHPNSDHGAVQILFRPLALELDSAKQPVRRGYEAHGSHERRLPGPRDHVNEILIHIFLISTAPWSPLMRTRVSPGRTGPLGLIGAVGQACPRGSATVGAGRNKVVGGIQHFRQACARVWLRSRRSPWRRGPDRHKRCDLRSRRGDIATMRNFDRGCPFGRQADERKRKQQNSRLAPSWRKLPKKRT